MAPSSDQSTAKRRSRIGGCLPEQVIDALGLADDDVALRAQRRAEDRRRRIEANPELRKRVEVLEARVRFHEQFAAPAVAVAASTDTLPPSPGLALGRCRLQCRPRVARNPSSRRQGRARCQNRGGGDPPPPPCATRSLLSYARAGLRRRAIAGSTLLPSQTSPLTGARC